MYVQHYLLLAELEETWQQRSVSWLNQEPKPLFRTQARVREVVVVVMVGCEDIRDGVRQTDRQTGGPALFLPLLLFLFLLSLLLLLLFVFRAVHHSGAQGLEVAEDRQESL